MATFLARSSWLLVALLFCALVALFAPTPLKAQSTAAHSCCAKVQMPADDAGGCAGHGQAPTKEQDASCCQACALGLAILFAAPAPFVNAQTGEQSLVSQNARSQSLPHRPPVPPPRFAVA